MRHEDDGPARLAVLLHPPERSPLELRIADREHLVHEQDLGLEMGGDGEREPHVHAARVALDGRVHELPDAGEVHDLRHLPRDLATAHAEDGAIEIDVLATGELGMEARADLEQAADAAPDHGGSFCRRS